MLTWLELTSNISKNAEKVVALGNIASYTFRHFFQIMYLISSSNRYLDKTTMHYFPLILILLLASSIKYSFAQTDQPMTKKIEVYGQAEEEITPDEIYFSITLKEYQNGNQGKVKIEQLERTLYQTVKNLGIKEEDFRIENVYGYNYDWYRKEKPQREEFLASKKYSIKFGDLNQVNELLASLDAKGIQSTNVDRYDHSKIEQYRKELKIKALQNAKEKASYLLQGVDERLGGILEVQEIDTGNDAPPVYYRQARGMAMASADAAESSPEIDFQKIKLSYSMRAVFEIQ